MEFIASDAEIKALVEKNGGPPYLTWVSSMMNTTTQTPRMKRLSYNLATSTPNSTLSLLLPRGEVRVFQLLI